MYKQTQTRNIYAKNLPRLTPEWLKLFFLFTWLHMLWLTANYLELGLTTVGLTANSLFHLSAWPFYSFLYAAPVLFLTWPVARLRKTAMVTSLLASLLCLLLVTADSMIYNLYAFHINGFVLNLISTPGGLSSLGGGSETYLSAAFIIARLLLVQVTFLAISLWSGRRNSLDSAVLHRHFWRTPQLRYLALAAAGLFLVQGCVYGISDIKNHGPVLDSSRVYPLFRRVRFRSLAAYLGITPEDRRSLRAQVDTSRLHYPLHKVQFSTRENLPNIVMLVAESLRWDQLTPEIMPNTWAFSQRSLYFTRHYSSGNGTREALFGMFYGLYGSYWENFLHGQRGPLLMERILDLDYELDIRTSAHFTYPEFDKTLFASVPVSQLHEIDESQPPWQRDEQNTAALVDFLAGQTAEKPFFSFFFLESTHAGYSFPEESAIRKPYLETLDYTSLSRERLAGERSALLNRYSNAAHWVDLQLARVFNALEQNRLLDNTIVIVTGDHGEEFMEHGAWGHNSSFVDEQTRVPLVVRMPGSAPATVNRVTSHMDVATTLLQTLGAGKNTDHYSLGRNLLDEHEREFIALSDWHSISVLTGDLKYRIPYLNSGIDHWSPTDPKDHPVPQNKVAGLVARNSALILRAMENCTLFSQPAALTLALNP